MSIKFLFLFLLLIITKSEFNESLAITFGYLNGAVSCQDQYVLDWICGPCLNVQNFSDVKIFKGRNKKTTGFIGFSPNLNAIIIVFRGTSNIYNVHTDLSYKLAAYPLCNNNCKVHKGFYKTFEQIYPSLQRLAEQYSNKYNAPFYITGLSLGAALATHAAVHLSNAGFNISQFYTFGSPRVGNKLFHEWFDKQYSKQITSYRIVHNKDPIPHLPPKTLGFQHIGTQIYYNSDCSSYKICQKTKMVGEDLRCSIRHLPNLKKIMEHLNYWDMNLLSFSQKGLCH